MANQSDIFSLVLLINRSLSQWMLGYWLKMG
jgi:hypothetical protein